MLENLETLRNLRVLCMARNNVRQIGFGLDSCKQLRELNLAANKIWSFKDLLNLAHLPLMQKLAFSDPDFGENPVCELCNYQTYILFHLQQLTHLDTLLITDDAKQLAEATYMKKKMYYNMRIKTLKRNTTNILKKARDAMLNKVNHVNMGFNVLLRQLKDVEREIDDIRFSISSEPPPFSYDLGELQQKHSVLTEAVKEKVAEVQSIEAAYETAKDRLQEISEHNLSRLIVELETGGNIRLEDGRATDVWSIFLFPHTPIVN